MSKFLKQLLFISLGIAILVVGGLAIYSATPSGNLKIVGGYQQYGSGRPVAWWKMDEASWNGTAGEVVDSIGTNHGTAAGGATKANTTSTAVFGRAGSFDGTDDYVQLKSSDLISHATNSTVSAWVKPTITGAGTIYSENTSGVTFVLRLTADNFVEFGVLTVNNWYIPITTVAIPARQWSHIVGVLNSSDGMHIYINGVQYGFNANTLPMNPSFTIQDVRLGMITNAGIPAYYTGLIDDVRIYNYALTANQVKQIYNETAKIKMVNQENTTSTSNNPVGWWKMDEGSSSSTLDSSGNGNTGTLTGGVQWTTGKLGKGLSFDGVNDYVGVADNDRFSFTDGVGNDLPFSVCSWFKTTTTTEQAIISKYGDWITWEWDLRINIAAGGSGLSMLDTSINYISRKATESIAINTWYHMCATYNGNETSNGIVIYLNGNTTTILDFNYGPYAGMTNNNAPVSIGNRNYTPGNETSYFNGLIDDVRIYNRALSAEEVGQMYNSTKDGYLGNIKVSTGLVGYWKLDDNQSLTSVIDYSGKGNTGTAYSGTATTTSVLSTSTAMVGRAMSFDGVDDWVGVADSNNLSFTTGYPNDTPATVCAWIKATSFSANSAIVSKVNATAFEWELYNLSGTGVGFIMLSAAGAPYLGRYAPTPSVNVWHHICGVYDRTKLVSGIKVYIDGIRSDTTNETSGTYVGCTNGTSLVSIGRRDLDDSYFPGLIDEVKIWNYARSAEQIGQDYERGLRGLP